MGDLVAPSQGPDVMNDPEYATNMVDSEADTCRICRGEATEQEPLFYPCKCNGSIKFVHQDCLMEWLSHSHKKHCELCKTPFRFTKLYSPHMPQQLPLHIFTHRLLIHAVKFTATSLRFLLVACVWLGWLPWTMRSVWRLLFWFADGGWTSKIPIARHSTTSMRALDLAQEQLEKFSAKIIASGVSPLPENALQPRTTTSATVGDIMAFLPSLLEPFSETLNATAGESMVWTMFKDFFHSIGLHMTSSIPESPFGHGNSSLSITPPPSSGSASLLSEVGFLKNLTRWPTMNQMFISVLEGQIITVVVVVCFILIFLIREWVVQQQPGINVGAGFNAEFALPRGEPRRLQLDQMEHAEHEQLAMPEHRHDDQLAPIAHDDADFQDFDLAREIVIDPDQHERLPERDPVPVANRRIAQPRRNRTVRFDDEIREESERDESTSQNNGVKIDGPAGERREDLETNEPPYNTQPLRNAIARHAQPQRIVPDGTASPGSPPERHEDSSRVLYGDVDFDARVDTREDVETGGLALPETPPQRPGMPTRDALSPAVEIQRRLAERQQRPENAENRLEIREFLAIYRRAEGNAAEVLRIIKDEGQEERLNYWVKAMKGLQRDSAQNRRVPSPPNRRDSMTAHDGSNEDELEAVPAPSHMRNSSNVTENLAETPSQSTQSSDMGEIVEGKGKGKAADSLTSTFISSTMDSAASPIMSSKDVLPVSTEISPLSTNGSKKSVEGQQANTVFSYNTWEFPIHPSGSKDEEDNDGLSVSSSKDVWKEAQDARVQEAITKAREQHASNRTNSIGSTDEGSQSMIANNEAPNPDRGNAPAEDRQLAITEPDILHVQRAWTDDEWEDNPADEGPEPNPFAPDGILPPEREPIARPQAEPLGIMGRIVDWLWGDVGGVQPQDDNPGNDEHVVQDLAAEAPFVPVANAQHGDLRRDLRAEAEQADQNLEVLEAAIAAGIDPNDPDALDEAEDFDGIMELIGMRGPLTGLLQNGMFSAVLISLTVSCGIWIPYNFGKLVLLLLAHPVSTAKLPLKLVFSCAELLIDMSLVAIGFASYLILCIAALPAALVSIASASVGSPTFLTVSTFGSQAWQVSVEACSRITGGFLSNVWHIADSEVPAFSATSHESLLIIKSWLYESVVWIAGALATLVSPKSLAELSGQIWQEGSFIVDIRDRFLSFPAILLNRSSWIITLNIPGRSTPLDPELASWSGVDRFWAIFAGYAALSVLGALYLRRGAPFSTGRTGKEYEAHLADLLNQAGGVMKVILIISIEMLVFPLYCGLLLDFALLPIFENATFMSRILFTFNSPLTSMFVHWFVGTCYMFHFALFVSMCRKIMRNGVLYFIRDPDDPTFHPVRDVLERNVYTQLRKITFSALVYGALVIVCLGGVVWGLSFTFRGVLPIHWSSNEPVLEFPIDLLFYNFMMPLAVRFFKPSDGLHAMYSWWFRKCARLLRLTWFLFDERKKDEEGHHVRRHWYSIFKGVKGNAESTNIYLAMGLDPFEKDKNLQAYFVKDGKYVRTPASDQVRIPKGAKVFLEVTEDDKRLDGVRDRDNGLHGRAAGQFKKVYIPPLFRLRIFVFILSIWLFAALTGLCITIVPLVFGREVFKLVIPNHLRMNDIYAFSIGIYILGSILYCSVHTTHFLTWAKTTINHFISTTNSADLLRRSSTFLSRTLRTAYLYASFTFLLPTLFAMIIEFYFIVPLHTYFSDGGDRHITHFIQSWTLGLLYVKLSTRFILWHNQSRAARALRQITAEPNSWHNPDIRIATRFFVLPATIISFVVLVTPLILGWIATKLLASMSATGAPLNEAQKTLIYRYSYPGILFAIAAVWLAWGVLGVLRGWRTRIRDEVYLIGERLHNFGEGRRKVGGVVGVGSVVQGVGRRVDT